MKIPVIQKAKQSGLVIFFFLCISISSLSAQDFSVRDLQVINEMSTEDAEKIVLNKWGISKTQEVFDVPGEGVRNVQFQLGSMNNGKFLNLEKITLYEENILTSLFVRDNSETYNSLKQELLKEGYVQTTEIENFLAPFQTHLNTEFYIKEEKLVQLETYEGSEKQIYHLILVTTPKEYERYKKLSR